MINYNIICFCNYKDDLESNIDHFHVDKVKKKLSDSQHDTIIGPFLQGNHSIFLFVGTGRSWSTFFHINRAAE